MVATIAVSSSNANASALQQEKQNKKTVQLMLNLAQLQNLIKRDPDAYKEEFLMQKSMQLMEYTEIYAYYLSILLFGSLNFVFTYYQEALIMS